MRRPLILRWLPPPLRTRWFYRFYRRGRESYHGLYANAPLHHAPGVSMCLWPGDEGHACIAFTGLYELELTQRLLAAARRGGTLVDVGANYGYYSLLWASQQVSNRVLAFEASPRNFAPLEENIRRNRLGDRIELQRVALGRAAGRLAFDVGPPDQSGWGGLASPASSSTLQVDVLRLDDVWQRDDEIAVLKIDVEGADAWVLEGARRLLQARRIRTVYYEENRPRMLALGIAPGNAAGFLADMGYRVQALSDPRRDLVEFEAHPRDAHINESKSSEPWQ
jgi:FkbM family methyltransferase